MKIFNSFLSKNNNGYWYVYFFNQGGKRSKISTKTKNLNIATKFHSNWLTEKKQKLTNISIGNFVEFYKKSRIGLAKGTLTNSNCFLNKFIEYFGKDFLFSNLTPEMFHNYFLHQYGHRQASTINVRRAYFLCLFNFAKENNYISKDFVVPIKRIKEVETLPKYFSLENFNKFIAGLTNIDFKDLCYSAFYTGMRLSELINLKWTEVDFEKGCVYVQFTKSKRVRTIPLTDSLIELLRNRYVKYQTENVFAYRLISASVRNFTPQTVVYSMKENIRYIFGNECKLTFHSFRHGFATELLKKGASILSVCKLLGHSSISITERYLHFCIEDLQFAIKKMENKNEPQPPILDHIEQKTS